MSSSTQDNLLAALSLYSFNEVQLEYRVYYDPVTYVCTVKSVDGGTGEYIVVDKAVYDSIDFCPNFMIKDGQLVKRRRNFSKVVLLEKAVNTGFKTLKDNNIFVLPDDQEAGEYWDLRKY